MSNLIRILPYPHYALLVTHYDIRSGSRARTPEIISAMAARHAKNTMPLLTKSCRWEISLGHAGSELFSAIGKGQVGDMVSPFLTPTEGFFTALAETTFARTPKNTSS